MPIGYGASLLNPYLGAQLLSSKHKIAPAADNINIHDDNEAATTARQQQKMDGKG